MLGTKPFPKKWWYDLQSMDVFPTGNGLNHYNVDGDMYVPVNWANVVQSLSKSLLIYHNLLTINIIILNHIEGLVADHSDSIANTLELLQSCTKP